MALLERFVRILELFTDDRPAWSVQDAAAELGVPTSTLYRQLRSLIEAGFIDGDVRGGYRLGPAFISFDRQIRMTDPLLAACRPLLPDIARQSGADSFALVCRLYGDSVMCVDMVSAGPSAGFRPSYERGRRMPLFRGATSKVILARLPPARLRAIYERHGPEIVAAKLGASAVGFVKRMRELRPHATLTTRAEIDPGHAGVAAPLISAEGRVLGSLSVVVPEARLADGGERRIALLVATAAGIIQDAFAGEEASSRESGRRRAGTRR